MVPTFTDLTGPQAFQGKLPDRLIKTKRSWEAYSPTLDGSEQLLALMAGKMDKSGKLIESSLINLTGKVQNKRLTWDVPEGEWKLMAFWYELGDKSPKIRYDVNEFLHRTGLNVFYKGFLGWCEAHHIKGRIQTYGFNSDNIESAGMAHIPEMEVTSGEKDQVDWFDTRIGPKKYVSSGAHLYDRKIVSAEVYTFIHWERYRETLEELKIASDGYLLSGGTKFYNSGFNFLPEQEVAPSRSIPNVETIPVKTLEFIEKYAKQGGRVLFLERLPEKSTGLANAIEMDIKVKEIVTRLFNEPAVNSTSANNLYGIKEAKNDPTVGFQYGKGRVYRLNNVIDRQIWWNKQSSYLDPFLKILRNRIAPDFGIDFTLPGEYLAKDQKIYLDLGKVGNIAEIKINGHEAGIVWMRGQQPEVTLFLKTGLNHLEIQVTNTLINRIASMKEPTPVPDYLVSRYGSKDKSTEVPREFGFSPLPSAGLLGPVRLIPARKVVIKL